MEHKFKIGDKIWYLDDTRQEQMSSGVIQGFVTKDCDGMDIEFAGLKEVIHASYEHEIQVSKWLDNIALNAMAEKDLALFNFMDWFILENIEEEAKFQKLIDRITLMEKTNTPLYFLDKELEEMV